MKGGKAGLPFCVTVDVHGAAKDLGGLVDGEPLRAGQVMRVVTTGGGGWGDPLEREIELVCRDVNDGKVSVAAAKRDYGVVLRRARGAEDYEADATATRAQRAAIRKARPRKLPMIDRGPGYERLARAGATSASRTVARKAPAKASKKSASTRATRARP